MPAIPKSTSSLRRSTSNSWTRSQHNGSHNSLENAGGGAVNSLRSSSSTSRLQRGSTANLNSSLRSSSINSASIAPSTSNSSSSSYSKWYMRTSVQFLGVIILWSLATMTSFSSIIQKGTTSNDESNTPNSERKSFRDDTRNKIKTTFYQRNNITNYQRMSSRKNVKAKMSIKELQERRHIEEAERASRLAKLLNSSPEEKKEVESHESTLTSERERVEEIKKKLEEARSSSATTENKKKTQEIISKYFKKTKARNDAGKPPKYIDESIRNKAIKPRMINGRLFPPEARGGGLAACILIKDENHNLPEWIAYHYYTLPLRQLVVTVDPSSLTSPTEILEKWSSSGLNLGIVEWSDARFMPPELLVPLPRNATFNETVLRHRERQNHFYGQCMRYLRNRKWTWTLLIDVDEYLVFNHPGDDESQYLRISNDSSKPFEFTLTNFTNETKMTWVQSTMLARTILPKPVGKRTFSEYLNEHRDKIPWLWRPCLTMARLTFGNLEEPNKTLLHQQIPSQFDPMNFNTLRFFRHATKGKKEENKYGKTMIDVRSISHSSVIKKTRQVHTPVEECGPIRSANPPYNISLFRVNHYSSSMEAFFSKTDQRRTAENYEWRAKVNSGTIYDMKPWLLGFVNEVGLNLAMKLLEGAGNLEDLKRANKLKLKKKV